MFIDLAKNVVAFIVFGGGYIRYTELIWFYEYNSTSCYGTFEINQSEISAQISIKCTSHAVLLL